MNRGSLDRVRIKLERLAHAADLALPAYQTAEAAGLDLVAAVPASKPVQIAPGRRAEVPTGVCLHLPVGTEGQVRPRSGLAARHGLTVLNSPGTIDSDYRGEIKVWLINHGDAAVDIARGDRIAQLVIARVTHATVIEVEALETTGRGLGGFGSTGVATAATTDAASGAKKGKALSSGPAKGKRGSPT